MVAAKRKVALSTCKTTQCDTSKIVSSTSLIGILPSTDTEHVGPIVNIFLSGNDSETLHIHFST